MLNPQTQPLLTPPTVCYDYSYPDGNSNLNSHPLHPHHHQHQQQQQRFTKPNAGDHHYEQPMVVFGSGQSPADSIGKKTATTSRSSESGSCTTNSSSQQQQMLMQQQQQQQQQQSPMSSGGTFDRLNGNGFPLSSSTPLPPTPSSPRGALPPPTTAPPPPPMCSAAAASMADPKFTTWASVNTNGARVSVPECSVFLTVPPGALPPGQAADLFLSVLHSSSPPLAKEETLLSPVVACGPAEASARLRKPLTLTLPHSASLRHGNWSVSLWRNDRAMTSSSGEDKSTTSWHRVVTLGQETLNTPVYAQLDLNSCHVMSDRLTCLALVGESLKSSGPATKSLRLAAFAQSVPANSNGDLTVRVYCLPDTDAALAAAVEQERRLFDGRLLDRPAAVLVTDGAGDLCMRMEPSSSSSSGWQCREGSEYLEVPLSHVWGAGASAGGPLHCSFTLRPANSNTNGGVNGNGNSTNTNGSVHSRSSGHSSASSNNGNSLNRLSFTLVVSQENSNATLMQVDCDLMSRRSLNNNPYESPSSSSSVMTTTSRSFRLSQAVLSTLSGLLDPPNAQGNDWRMLAERLNVHRYPAYFASRASPTEAILALWEARNREILAVSNLGNVLRGMGRFDAANVLERSGDNNGNSNSNPPPLPIR